MRKLKHMGLGIIAVVDDGTLNPDDFREFKALVKTHKVIFNVIMWATAIGFVSLITAIGFYAVS